MVHHVLGLILIYLPGSLSSSPPERIAAALVRITVKIRDPYIHDSSIYSSIDHYIRGPDLGATVVQDRIIMKNVVKLQRHLTNIERCRMRQPRS